MGNRGVCRRGLGSGDALLEVGHPGIVGGRSLGGSGLQLSDPLLQFGDLDLGLVSLGQRLGFCLGQGADRGSVTLRRLLTGKRPTAGTAWRSTGPRAGLGQRWRRVHRR